MSPVRFTRTLQTVTWILHIPKYSICSQKNFITMHLSANLATSSFIGSSTSHWDACCAKELLKYVVLKPHQSPDFNIDDDQGEDLGL